MVNPALVDPDTIRATAAEAWIRGRPILENYRTLYTQALDDADPRYVGGFGVFRHYPRPFTPANTDVVSPSNDTPYSWAWLDLRTEPWVLSVPAVDRYYVLPVHELDTVYAGFVGSRSTGQEAGDHLVAGPDWDGEPPAGISSVIRAATRLVGIVGRTQAVGTSPEAVRELGGIQQRYLLRPLHVHTGTPEPEPARQPVWPVWRESVLDTVEFFSFLDFLLGFFPALPTEAGLRGRLTDLGVDGRGEFEPATLPMAVRAEMERGIADGKAALARAVARTESSVGLFGTRERIGTKYLEQAVGAVTGLYGLPVEEAWYGAWQADSEGHRPPDAGRRDHRTPGLVRDPDGGLTLHLSHRPPTDPAAAANWLPVPDGPFTAVLRLYGPDGAVLDGRWTPPPLTPR